MVERRDLGSLRSGYFQLATSGDSRMAIDTLDISVNWKLTFFLLLLIDSKP